MTSAPAVSSKLPKPSKYSKYKRRQYKRRNMRKKPTLTQKVNKLSKEVHGDILYGKSFDDDLDYNLNATTPIRTVMVSQPYQTKKMWGVNHNLTMSASTFNAKQFVLHSMKCNVMVELHARRDPTNFLCAIVRPSKMGNMRSVLQGSWTTGEDFYIDITGKIVINPKYWTVVKSRRFELSHLEHINTAPPTDSNQPVGGSYRRFTLNYKLPKPIKFERGDVANVWDLQYTEMTYLQRYLFVCITDNTSTTDSARVNMHRELSWSCPS